MAIESLDDLFHETLRDVLYAEKKLTRALPKLAKAAANEMLSEAFLKHAEETRGQVDRLGRVFEIIGKPARGKRCPAMDGLVEEGEEIVEDTEAGLFRDAGLTAGAQAVEHYEIARYRALVKLATTLGHGEAAEILRATLEEEIATDEILESLSNNLEDNSASSAEPPAKKRAPARKTR